MIEDRKAVFKVMANGEMHFKPMKDREAEDNDTFEIDVWVQTRKGEGERWSTKRLNRESLEAVGDPAVNPEKPVGFRAKVTGDIAYEVRIEQTRDGLDFRAWLTDLAQRPPEVEEKPEADEKNNDKKDAKEAEKKPFVPLDVRLVIAFDIPDIYYYMAKDADEKEVKRTVKGSDLRIVNAKGKRLSFDFEDKLDPKEEGLEEGFIGLQLKSDKLEKMKGLVVTSTKDKGLLNFVDYAGNDVHEGFKFGIIKEVNQLGTAEDPGLLIEIK